MCSQVRSLFDDISNAKALNPQAEKAHTHAQEPIRITFPPERKEEKLSKVFVCRNGHFGLIKLGPIEGFCTATVACVSPVVCCVFCMSNFLSQE